MSFRRGAFQAMRAIQPCFVTFRYCHIRPTYDVIGIVELLMLLFSSFQINISTLNIMPIFVPN